ncbi:hypothetical protein ZIOFF_023366 [Zingiber officinale]|uniref:DNA-binding protein BIN4 n=1 Tax=Zingiber officinale TaxID=94328 RepID=A0A8J5H0U4_ZINOF|nr:hypothetical protein ZIOFF_023366 [Zingiber officinale]
MSDSREGSPDWLRLFQVLLLLSPPNSLHTIAHDSRIGLVLVFLMKPPSTDVVTVSSGSDSSPVNNPKRSAHAKHDPKGRKSEQYSIKIDNGEESLLIKTEEPTDAKQEPKGRKNERDSIKNNIGEESLLIKTVEPTDAKHENNQILSQDALSPNKKEPIEESTQDKPAGSSVSRLPLVFTDKVQRSKALVECDGDSIDLRGDVGAVGRIVISNGPTGNNELLLDLKGTVYKTTIVPSRTFCVVSIGQSEAKIEAIMNDFIQLEPKSNVFEAETMVEGTLDDFSFDSEEEADKVTKHPVHQSDQTNEDGDHTDKTKGSVRKKAKMITTPAKKGAKNPQVSKRTRKSKK